MAENLIALEDCGGYAIITLKQSVLSVDAQQQLLEVLKQTVGKYPAMIVTGSGPVFCEGFEQTNNKEYSRQGHAHTALVEAIRTHPAVFIAAVNGRAISDGVSLVNVCDLAIAAENTELSLPEITKSTYPTVAGPSTQLRILRKHASWMILTGKPVAAPMAARWGLINKAVPAEQLMPAARATAEGIAKLNPVTVDWSKKAMDDIPAHVSDWTAALEYGRAVTAVIQNQIGKENFMPKKF